ncbi:MAG: sugar ABC transporter substrate-binding protein [Phyllobacteriaceae bacterium]|jgi:ribose transport system substrate-binding protein|nr:sugar ABC transporter substrate-binding protein [Phyllobacteriaceae bacterium]
MMTFKNSIRTCAVLALSQFLALPLAAQEIAVFTKNQVDPFFNDIRVGAEMAAAAKGWSTVQYVPTKPNNLTEQISQLEDASLRNPDAILFVPIDPDALAPVVERVANAGIPIVNVADRAASGSYLTFVGFDDVVLGEVAAKALADRLGGEGRVVIIEGVKGSKVNEDRVNGFRSGLSAFPSIEVITSQPANFQRLQALQVMENLIQSTPDIDGVLASIDAMALGALEAIEAAGIEAQVVGVDGISEAVEAVRDGRMAATAEFSGFKMSCLAIEAVDRAANGLDVPAEILLSGSLITAENAGDFLVPLEEQTCPDWDAVVN